MPLLILSPRQTPDAAAIRAAAEDAGWRVEQFTSWRAPGWLRGHDLVLYAEPLFVDVVTPALGLTVQEPPLDWLVNLPPHYRQRTVRLTTLGEARAQPTPAFIKPAEDKCFAAAVYPTGASLPPSVAVLPDATPVLVSEPVHWDVEYRCFVLDRAVVTLSPYLRHGAVAQGADGSWPGPVDEREQALAYAAEVVASPAVLLPPAVVVDVGKIAGGGWAVVEANAAWGSGLYGCEAPLILPVLRRATRRDETLTPDDRVWRRKQYVVETE
jgi:hypothetical protein